jgi:Uncharacterised nucleotidyltransferase
MPAKTRGAESGRAEIQPPGGCSAASGEPADLNWEKSPAIPPCVAALLAGQVNLLATEAEWKAALHYFDRNQFTLLLPRAGLPEDVQRRLDKNAVDNQERVRRLKQSFAEIDDAIKTPFLVLKGFANWDQFTPDPLSRVQYDLDLYCPDTAIEARDALTCIGYESIHGGEKFPTDHLPALVRKTGWQWHGDFFDPEIPLSVELHFRLWDEDTEGFPAPGIEQFWVRRVQQTLEGRPYLALHPVDALGYAALHLLRHLLRGDVRAANIYELAWFLNRNAADDEFWSRWRDMHGPELRRLQAICFRLAAAWFDCRLNPIAQAEVDALERRIGRWFDQCAASPAEAYFRPNKDELWLHLGLLDSPRKKMAVLRRRLFPTRLPGPLDSVFIPAERMTWGLRLRKRWQYAWYVSGRAAFHLRALLPTLSRMLRIRR